VSSTSRKCRTLRARRSAAHTNATSNSTVGGGQHLIECRTLRLRPADLVGVLVNDLEPALLRKPPQIERLCLRILSKVETRVYKIPLFIGFPSCCNDLTLSADGEVPVVLTTTSGGRRYREYTRHPSKTTPSD
jgi:hypothetical protein